ncbi:MULTISPECIES: CBS domain-containing protein [unclassified Pseudonocardia]|uniref:CBS domain-containing protein n=1 Tax=unclassified Pseudonocardia TaxID=2619320 RepID=UPI0009EA7739|nr:MULTISPECIES: CBS domain-containing protein [unclassified Pseudonocardia]
MEPDDLDPTPEEQLATGQRSITDSCRPDAPPETLDPRLRQLMSTRLVAITPNTPIRTALDLMLVQGTHHLPVFDGVRCVGVVTESDVLRGIAAQHSPIGHVTLTAESPLVRAIVLPESTRLVEAAAAMSAKRQDMVLVESGGRVRGIVTATDIVRHYATRH